MKTVANIIWWIGNTIAAIIVVAIIGVPIFACMQYIIIHPSSHNAHLAYFVMTLLVCISIYSWAEGRRKEP